MKGYAHTVYGFNNDKDGATGESRYEPPVPRGVELCGDDPHYAQVFETPEELEKFISELREAGRVAFGDRRSGTEMVATQEMADAGADVIDQYYGVLTLDLLAAEIFEAMVEADKPCERAQAPRGAQANP